MAVSLSYGILFATLITLILIPCLYLILEDLKRGFWTLLGYDMPAEPERDRVLTEAELSALERGSEPAPE